MPKYKKIASEDILQIMENKRWVDYIERLHSSSRLAKCLNTSTYQVRKCLRQLKEEGKVKYISRVLCDKDYESQLCYCESHLPEWGYVLVKSQS